MASLWKHPKSRFWTACFTAPDGRQLKRSTKTTDRKLANRMAQEWEDAACKRMTEGQARRVVNDIFELINGERLASATLAAFVNRWLERKRVESKPRTFEKYAIVARKFVAFLASRAGADIASITQAEIAAYRDDAASRLSIGTANGELKIIRSIFQQAHRDALIDQNPAARVAIMARHGDEVERRAFTLPELSRILGECDSEWRGLVMFGLYSGQRLKDVATLTWQNIDLDRDQLCLVTGKTNRRQIIPLASPLRRFIDESLAAGDDPKAPLFPRSIGYVKRSKSGTAGVLSDQFYHILAAVGLAKPRTHESTGKGRSVKRELNELGFHCLRHTATSLMKNAGISPAIVQDIIGHDSSAVSAHYTHIEESAKRKAVDAMPLRIPQESRPPAE